MNSENSLSRWLMAGVPAVVVLGVLGVIALHIGAKAPWITAIPPVIVLLALFSVLYVVMYWVRKQFHRSHDLRLGILAFGIFGLVTGLVGMRSAGQLGIANPTIFRDNFAPFSVYVGVVTLIALILFTFWRLK